MVDQWTGEDCPACRDIGRVTSVQINYDMFENWWERCHVQWNSVDPVELVPNASQIIKGESK